MEQAKFSHEAAQNRVPYWARSTNPIVRRHLGLYWRTLPPQFEPILYAIGIWAAVLFLTIPLPFMFDLTMPLIVVGVLAIPIAVLAYAHILFSIAVTASTTMAEEIRNNTISLLRTTPMSLDQIFLGKIAAAIWKRIDDIVLIALVASIFSVPILVMNYANIFPPEENPLIMQTTVVIGLIVSLVRLAIEPIMVGAIAVMIGAFTLYRSAAITSSLVITGFYFLLINLLQFVPKENQVLFKLFVDIVVPLVAPLLIIWISLRIAGYIVTRD